MKHDYIQEVKLKHNEIPAKINLETGDVTEIVNIKKNIPINKNLETFNNNQTFHRCYTESWKLLKTQTSKEEYYVAYQLALKAKAFSNSLEPLCEESTVKLLSEEFNIGINQVTKIFNKLFELGVYGKFEVTEIDRRYKKYWVFNPYLSFNGVKIEKGISQLFKNTIYAKISNNFQ